MPAIPLIIGGVNVGVSAYQAHKAGQASKAQAGIMGQQTGLANEIASFARQQHSMAEPALGKAMQYYMQLAGGNRGVINSALAPDRAQLNETYKGAEQGIQSRTAPGPARDRAIADLYRQRAGQLGIMPFQAKTNAMGQLGSYGQDLLGRAAEGYGAAGSALSGASATGVNLNNSRQNAANMWGNFTSNLSDIGMDAYDWYRKSRNTGFVGPQR